MKKSEFANVATAAVSDIRSQPARKTPQSYPQYRQGKKAIIFYGPPELSDELKRLGIDLGTTLQEMLVEASNDFLRKHGRHRVG